jgi:glycosyltransferase involved in cell wall biosynthesis
LGAVLFVETGMKSKALHLQPLRQPALLSVVIPVYNEEAWIEEVVRRVLASDRLGCGLEVVIVDDCSTDGTAAVLERIGERNPTAKVFRQEHNQGKGAALRRGFREATGDLVLVQDADLEYHPADYPMLLRPLLDGKADVVFGSRFLGGPHRVLYYWHSVGNWVLTNVSNSFSNLNLSDMETGYKVFRREVLEQITVEQDRFGFEPEITVKVARLGARVYEVPITYAGRTYEEGKKIRWKDGVQAMYCIVRYGMRR